jgi:hypothetical protein
MRKLILLSGAAVALLCAGVAMPARADDWGWHHGWHRWHHDYWGPRYYPPRAYYYAPPPPVYYAPAPAYYAPGASLGINIPIR